jgi:hypothetical protein
MLFIEHNIGFADISCALSPLAMLGRMSGWHSMRCTMKPLLATQMTPAVTPVSKFKALNREGGHAPQIGQRADVAVIAGGSVDIVRPGPGLEKDELEIDGGPCHFALMTPKASLATSQSFAYRSTMNCIMVARRPKGQP